MTRQGVMAMYTNPEVLPAAMLGALSIGSLAFRRDQFFTGMVSRRTCCAKLAGIKAAAATKAAR